MLAMPPPEKTQSNNKESNRKLVKLVKENPCLYNNTGSKTINAVIWKHIAEELGMPEDKCKKQWNILKYTRPYYLEEDLAFYLPYRKISKSLKPNTQETEDFFDNFEQNVQASGSNWQNLAEDQGTLHYRDLEVKRIDAFSQPLNGEIIPKVEKPDLEILEQYEPEVKLVNLTGFDARSSDNSNTSLLEHNNIPQMVTKRSDSEITEGIQSPTVGVSSNNSMEGRKSRSESVDSQLNEERRTKFIKLEPPAGGHQNISAAEERHKFLLTILPDLKEMTNQQMRTFKVGITSLIQKILDGHDYN